MILLDFGTIRSGPDNAGVVVVANARRLGGAAPTECEP